MKSASHHHHSSLSGSSGRTIRLVHDGLGVGQANGLPLLHVEIEIRLSEGLIVGVGEAVVEQLPVGALRKVHHGVVILRIACGLRGSEQAVIERSESPLLVEVRFGDGDLPVGDLLHHSVDSFRLQLWGEAGRQRARIVGRIADVCPLH